MTYHPEDDPAWPTAIHEAGHALMAHHVGRGVHSVTVARSAANAGHCSLVSRRIPGAGTYRLERHAKEDAMVSLAGPIAEAKWVAPHPAGAGIVKVLGVSIATQGSDAAHALYWAGEVNESDAAAEAWLAWIEATVRDVLASPLMDRAVPYVAERLVEQRTLTGREVRAYTADARFLP